METTIARRGVGWIWLTYPVLWGVLRLLYLAANKTYGAQAPEENLSLLWWSLVLLWFLADVSLVLGFTFLQRKFTAHGGGPRTSFGYAISEIVPIWLLLHLSLLLFEHPIATRLESVGLGLLEVIVFAVAMIAGISYVFRLTKANKSPTELRAGGIV